MTDQNKSHLNKIRTDKHVLFLLEPFSVATNFYLNKLADEWVLHLSKFLVLANTLKITCLFSKAIKFCIVK